MPPNASVTHWVFTEFGQDVNLKVLSWCNRIGMIPSIHLRALQLSLSLPTDLPSIVLLQTHETKITVSITPFLLILLASRAHPEHSDLSIGCDHGIHRLAASE